MNKKITKVHFDFEHINGLMSPRKKLDLQGPALGFIRLKSDEGYTFTHSHRRQEEVYIVIEGDGAVSIDGELIDITAGDVVRVSPEVRRAVKAGSEGIFIICAGGVPAGYPENHDARYLIDDGIPYYDDIPPWYAGNEEVIRKNRHLKERMLRSERKKQGR